MATRYRTRIILGVLSLIGTLGVAIAANWDKLRPHPTSTGLPPISTEPGTQIVTGDNNVQISGSNNVVNPPKVPTPCRHKSHGVEKYQRVFVVNRASHWMGGGFDQGKWCHQVIGELRGEHPEGVFEIVSKSENSKNTCSPFNCPQYQYFCEVKVSTDPLFIEKLSNACS